MYLTAIKAHFQLRKNLSKKLDQLKADQWRAFCRIVEHAYNNVPLYRRLYDEAGFHPHMLKTPEDALKIPTVKKKMFQGDNIEECLTRGVKKEQLLSKRTSGSTGFPLFAYFTRQDRIYRTLMHLRILFANGMGLRDKMVQICDKRNAPNFGYLFQQFGFLSKDFMFCADPVAEQIDRLTEINPAVIYSYKSSLVLIADELLRRGGCPFRPKLLFTTGELLTPYEREKIEKAFSLPLYDIYGLVEMADVAWQCRESNGYHLNIDSFYIEILKDNRPAEKGESGKLVISNLYSRAMPFIRYEVGDIFSAPSEEPCPCGCNFPRIDLLQGREDDWLFSSDGRRISPMDITVAQVPGVKQYRIVQKDYTKVSVEIVPGVDFSENTLSGVRNHVSEMMGQGVDVNILQVDQIPLVAGKLKCFFCEIES